MHDPLIGETLGDYTIIELLGQGGMARVYRGYDENLERYAAVKVINANLEFADIEEYQARFTREARAIARLEHPSIVGVYQFDKLGAHYFMAMKYIEGKDLREVLQELSREDRRLSNEQIMRVVRDIGSALDYAHEHGVIHRDVKPSNIMIEPDGRAVLTDFGLALTTREGTIGNTFGTAHYIAPEQAISSAQAGPQSDLYSLGVVLYEMLTGAVPFDDPSAMSVALKHLSEPPPSPTIYNPDLNPALEKVVLKALEKEAEARFASGHAMYEALREAFDDDVWPDDEDTTELQAQAAAPPPAPTPADYSDEPTPVLGTPVEALRSGSPQAAAPADSVPAGQETERGGGNRGMVWLALIALLAIAVVVILLLASGGGEDAPAAADSQTQTAAALAALVDDPTATDTVESSPTEEPETAAPTETAALSNTPAPTDTPAPTETDEPTVTTAPSETPVPSDTPSATPSETAASTETQLSTTTDAPTLTALPAETTGALPTLVGGIHGGEPVVLLVYDEEALLLVNQTGRRINIASWVFLRERPGGGLPFRFDAVTWDRGGGTAPASALPADQCFQIWRSDLGNSREWDTDLCETRAAFWLAGRDSRFWLSDDPGVTFDVTIAAGEVLQTCEVSAGMCVVPLAQDD